MPLDVSKYVKIKKKKKPTCIRLLKIFFKTIINFIKIDIGKYFKSAEPKHKEQETEKIKTLNNAKSGNNFIEGCSGCGCLIVIVVFVFALFFLEAERENNISFKNVIFSFCF